MDIGGTFIIEHWSGTFRVSSGAARSSDSAREHEAELALFSLRHAFANHHHAVVEPIERWFGASGGGTFSPGFGISPRARGAFGASPSVATWERTRMRAWDAFEVAVRSGRLGLTRVEHQPELVVALEPSQLPPLEGPREAEPTYFEATIVDEIGQPITGLEMVLSYEGQDHDLVTNGAGQVRQDGATASRASLRVKNTQQLRDIVTPRWATPRQGAFPQAKNLLRAELGDGMGSFPLAAKDEHLIVITPVVAPLHVEWWDGRGKHRHIECSYQVSGPRTFSGKTDKNGQLLHPDVPLGDYTLKLTVEYFAGRSYAKTRTFEEKVTLTKGSGLQVLRVGPTPEVAFRRTRGYLFDLNKSFLMPRAAKQLLELPTWWKERAPSQLLIVGHTDITGNQGFNDLLSQARADAVKAFLEQDVDAWLAYYDEQGSTKWGSREDRLMIRSLPDFAIGLTDSAARLTEGETSSGGDGNNGADSSSETNGTASSNVAPGANGSDAASQTNTSNGAGSNGKKPKPKKPESRRLETTVEWFQRTRGLEVDDIAGPATRRALISEYMGVGTVKPSETPGYPVSVATLGEGEDYPLAETGLPLDVQVVGSGSGSASENRSGSGNGGGSESSASTGNSAAENPLDRRVELFFFDNDFGILPSVGDVGGPEYIEWRKRAEEENDVAVEKEVRHVTFLELPDVLFRTDSCVVLPEGEAPIDGAAPSSGAGKHKALTSVGIFAAAIRFCDERPNYRLFLGGHADSVGGDSDNDKLSKERADVALALLTGDRDKFVSLVDERHLVSDYKQILSWCCKAFDDVAFTCDPGKIDDVEGTGVEAVKLFQAEYNEQRETLGVPSAEELAVDGDVGPMTWGAFFDVMQYGIAQELGEEVADVAQLRESLQWVDDSRRALGFGEKHPIDGRELDGYASQMNRRVEVMFFEYGHEPDLATSEETPEACDVYLPGEYERVKLHIVSARRWRARWQDDVVNMSVGGRIVLETPGCPAGEVAKLLVKMVEYDCQHQTVAVAGGDIAQLVFRDWRAPADAPFGEKMAGADEFPEVHFTFQVELGGRLFHGNTIVYRDELRAVLALRTSVGEVLLSNEEYVLSSPWGNRYGKTDEIGQLEQLRIPPGGFTVGARGREMLVSGRASFGREVDAV